MGYYVLQEAITEIQHQTISLQPQVTDVPTPRPTPRKFMNPEHNMPHQSSYSSSIEPVPSTETSAMGITLPETTSESSLFLPKTAPQPDALPTSANIEKSEPHPQNFRSKSVDSIADFMPTSPSTVSHIPCRF